jgi:hypothetical protein
MKLDLSAGLTVDDVRNLLASTDDSIDRQLRVTVDGIAFICEDAEPVDRGEILFRFETWDSGNGYSGSAAANDNVWVKQVYATLKKNWPNRTSFVVDTLPPNHPG